VSAIFRRPASWIATRTFALKIQLYSRIRALAGLPFLGPTRMDDQAIYNVLHALPENLASLNPSGIHGPAGRFFASLVIHEGEKIGAHGSP
jgi:hypothetical protein